MSFVYVFPRVVFVLFCFVGGLAVDSTLSKSDHYNTAVLCCIVLYVD